MLGFGSKEKKAEPITAGRTAASFARVGDKMVEVDPVTRKPLTSAPETDDRVSGAAHQSDPNHIPSRVDSATITVVTKPLVAPSAASAPSETDGGASGDNAATANSTVTSSGQNEPVATSGAQAEESPKPIPVDEKYLRKLNAAVEDNSKQAAEIVGGFNALVELIERLNADTVTQLGEKSSQLDAAKAELESLKAEEVDRLKVVDRLSRENAKLKDKCDEYDGIIADKDTQISQAANDLNAEKEKVKAKDAEIERLNKAQQDAVAAHSEEVAKLKSSHESEISDLEKKHGEEVDALNSSAAEQIEAVRKSVNDFVPAEVCDLFDYRVGEPVDDRSRWQAIYAYLGFINGNLRQDAFTKRFREFDAALYDAMRDTPDQLADCRARVQRHINEEIGKKSGGLLVCWPKVGEACNPDQYTTTSDFGQRISEVISAMIYKKGDDGKVLCQSKGKVATA